MDVNEMQEVNTYDVVRRDNKHNRRDHTFEWDKKMNVDIVWRFEFNDLPVAFSATSPTAQQVVLQLS